MRRTLLLTFDYAKETGQIKSSARLASLFCVQIGIRQISTSEYNPHVEK